MNPLVEIVVWLAAGALSGRVVCWLLPPCPLPRVERWFRWFLAPLLGAAAGVVLAAIEGRIDPRLAALVPTAVALCFATALWRDDLWHSEVPPERDNQP